MGKHHNQSVFHHESLVFLRLILRQYWCGAAAFTGVVTTTVQIFHNKPVLGIKLVASQVWSELIW